MEEIQKVDKVAVVETVKENNSSEKKISLPLIAMCTGVLLVAGAFLFTRGYIVAATVNGSPISRLAVIGELEKSEGKATLETLINKKLVESELNKLALTVDITEVSKRIAELEAQITAQGGTLEEVLVSEGMTLERLEKQIETTLQLEQVLKDKTSVTAEEVDAFIKTGGTPLPTGSEADAIKEQVKNQLQQQKFQTEAQKWIAEVTAAAKIKYYVTY
jgi:uncharacterized coiled-coil protein SlyX